MFTGLIQDMGDLVEVTKPAGAVKWWVRPHAMRVEDFAIGESISHDGVCLTVTAIDAARKAYEVLLGPETLRRTSLDSCDVGARVNLERAMQAGERFGGHMVAGHIDDVGTVTARVADGSNIRFDIAMPPALARYIVAKGSIAVNGISLTVNRVGDTDFSVSIIPHTCTVTTLGAVLVGQRVNLEVDLIGKYVERLLAGYLPTTPKGD